MSGLLNYFVRGMKSSIIVGAPDFETNNQHTDMINIGNDMRTSMRRVSNGETATGSTKAENPRRSRSIKRSKKSSK